jgi:hypothetical protein
MKMKFTRFVVILATVICQTGISPLLVYSQSYHKLIRTNTYWDNYFTDVMCYSNIDRIFFTGSDTIISGISYKMSRQFPFAAVYQGPLCPPFVIDTISFSTFSFIREDTIARKVYIYASEYSQPDQLLYDFSLKVGDTLKSEYNGDDTFIVTAIDTVTLNDGEFRKKFIFNNNPYFNYYIESLGGSDGLFTPYYEPNSGGYFCISQNDTSLWGTECDYYFVGMKEKQESKLSLYPDPAIDIITIEISITPAQNQLSIMNACGDELITRQITQPKTQIDVSSLPSGIYFVRLTSDRMAFVGKFVKQ